MNAAVKHKEFSPSLFWVNAFYVASILSQWFSPVYFMLGEKRLSVDLMLVPYTLVIYAIITHNKSVTDSIKYMLTAILIMSASICYGQMSYYLPSLQNVSDKNSAYNHFILSQRISNVVLMQQYAASLIVTIPVRLSKWNRLKPLQYTFLAYLLSLSTYLLMALSS